MWECDICKKVKVSDKGFRFFVKYEVVSLFRFDGKDKKYNFSNGTITRQIRICDKCLKKKGKSLEMEI